MRFVLPLLAASLASCAAYPPPPMAGPIPAAMPVGMATASAQLSFGGTAQLNGLTIRPVSIVEDSRCPASVQCVWAGRVRVLVALDGPGLHEQRTMEPGKPEAVPAGTLTLVDVMPRRQTPAPVPPGDYAFAFTLTR